MSQNTPSVRRPGRPQGSDGLDARDVLLKATRDLIIEKGLPRITVREVAERAGVGTALVSYYFGGKAGLLRAIIDKHAAEGRERLERAANSPGTAQDRVRRFLRETIEAMRDDPYLPRLIVEQVLFADDDDADRFAEEFARPNTSVLSKLLKEGVESGEFRDFDINTILPAMLGSCVFFFLSGPLRRRAFGIEEFAEDIIEQFAQDTPDLLLNGLTKRKSS